MGEEQRNHIRNARRLRVTIGAGTGFTLDVGPGGFCAETGQALEPGAQVMGSMRVGGEEVDFGGQVAWVRPGIAGSILRRRMGIRFTRVPRDLQQLRSAR